MLVEAREDASPESIQINDVDRLTLHRHVEMLFRAGLLEAPNPISIYDDTGVAKVFVRDLSWDGHGFLAVRKTTRSGIK